MDQAATFKDVFLSLRERIGSGEITGKLPSLARLQQEYEVSSNTVKKALTLLKEQRFTTGHQGKGIFVNPNCDFNPLAQKCVAMLMWDGRATEPFMIGVLDRIRRELEHERCNLIFLNTLSQVEAFASHYDVLVLCQQFDEGWPECLLKLDPARVIACNCRPLPGGFRVGSDNERGGYLAAERLYAAGCRRIGILRADDIEDEASYIVMRLHGAEQFAAEHPDLQLFAAGYRHSDVSLPRSLKPVADLFAERVDGVFVTMDLLAFRVYDYCRDHGIAIGREVRVIGFDNMNFCLELDPVLASIQEDNDGIGREIVAMIRRILCGHSPRKNVVVSPHLVEHRQYPNSLGA